jgi:hypothetical protein
MSLFDWLLIAHLAGDFLLQTDDMAKKKPEQWSWLARHIGRYMLAVTLIVAIYTWTHRVPLWVAAACLLFVVGTHVILDRRDFTETWMRRVGMSSDQAWLFIVVDQVFHLLTLAVIAQSLEWAGG